MSTNPMIAAGLVSAAALTSMANAQFVENFRGVGVRHDRPDSLGTSDGLLLVKSFDAIPEGLVNQGAFYNETGEYYAAHPPFMPGQGDDPTWIGSRLFSGGVMIEPSSEILGNPEGANGDGFVRMRLDEITFRVDVSPNTSDDETVFGVITATQSFGPVRNNVKMNDLDGHVPEVIHEDGTASYTITYDFDSNESVDILLILTGDPKVTFTNLVYEPEFIDGFTCNPNNICRADFNGDGFVDLGDLGAFMDVWVENANDPDCQNNEPHFSSLEL